MPSSNQFHHLGTAGRVPRKGTPKWASITGLTAEAGRQPGASNHVFAPRDPVILHGVSPQAAGRLATERADRARDAKGRRLRRDGVAMLCGVVSYPIPRATVEREPDQMDEYRRWRTATLGWCVKEFGGYLASAVEHRDEKYLHLHYFVVPDLATNGRLNLDTIHPGRRAKARAALEGASKPLQEKAYRKAMIAWQDAFHREVSADFGHDRYGPRRKRVNRIEHLMARRVDEEQARRRAEMEKEAAEAREAARRAREAFAEEMAEKRAEIAVLGSRAVASAFERVQQVKQNYAGRYDKLRAACSVLESKYVTERDMRLAAQRELEQLRERVAELETTSDFRPF